MDTGQFLINTNVYPLMESYKINSNDLRLDPYRTLYISGSFEEMVILHMPSIQTTQRRCVPVG